MGAFRVLATAVFVLSIPVALLTTNVRFVANEEHVYRYAIDSFGAVETSGIERSELLRAAGDLRAYFNDDSDTASIRVQRNGQEVSLFNPRETAHLKDVKGLFRIANRGQEFAVIYALAYIAAVVLWAREVSGRTLAGQVIAGGLLTVAVLGALGGVALTGFDAAWERFHIIAFANDFWLLNPRTDHLIQMFPPDFWERIVFFVGLLAVAESALAILAAGIYLGVTRRQPHQPAALYPSYT